MTKDFKIGAAIGFATTGAIITIAGLGVRTGKIIAEKIEAKKLNKQSEINQEEEKKDGEVIDVDFAENKNEAK